MAAHKHLALNTNSYRSLAELTRVVLLAGLTVHLGGCAGAMPTGVLAPAGGDAETAANVYKPAGAEGATMGASKEAVQAKTIGAPAQSSALTRTYGRQPDGTFALSTWDKGLSCARLEDAVRRRVAKMGAKAQQEKKAREGLPPTLLSAISWSSGAKFAESRAMREHRWLRAEADAYHQAMLLKACPPLAIDKLYAAVALPQPLKPTYKAGGKLSKVLEREH